MRVQWKSIGSVALKAATVANAILRVARPGVAVAEDAIVGAKRGRDRAAYVDALIAGALQAQDAIAPELIQNDSELLEGACMVRDGLVKIQNAVRRVATAGAK